MLGHGIGGEYWKGSLMGSEFCGVLVFLEIQEGRRWLETRMLAIDHGWDAGDGNDEGCYMGVRSRGTMEEKRLLDWEVMVLEELFDIKLSNNLIIWY